MPTARIDIEKDKLSKWLVQHSQDCNSLPSTLEAWVQWKLHVELRWGMLALLDAGEYICIALTTIALRLLLLIGLSCG